jgi:hypothetical protein
MRTHRDRKTRLMPVWPDAFPETQILMFFSTHICPECDFEHKPGTFTHVLHPNRLPEWVCNGCNACQGWMWLPG